MRTRTSLSALLVALLLPTTTSPQEIAPTEVPWFEEVAERSGIGFRHESGHRERHLFPEIMGGGAALFDMDGDGDLDAYLVQSGSLYPDSANKTGNRLYENSGDGSFVDVSEKSGADDTGYGMGVACADFDGDADVDLYVTNLGPDTLLRNDGSGRFTDVTRAAGLGDPSWGTSAAFLDYDADGDFDLYVCNYVNWSVETEIDCYNQMGGPDYCDPQNYRAPARDTLYRNEGDGTFTDVTEPSGVGRDFGTALGVVCGDFDSDGRVDVFVANDGMEDLLWMNQGDGTFRNDALIAGCGRDEDGLAKAGMGVTSADIDDDGDLDLLVCNLERETDSFFLNEGDYFVDRTAAGGLAVASRPFTRFGMGWVDLDNDGYLDLYQANGRVMRQSKTHSEDPFAEPNLLFRGRGAAFEEVEPRGGTSPPLVAVSRAAAFGDFDNDGGVDILVVNRDLQAHLLRNVAPSRGNWISFEVKDERGRDALGATVKLTLGAREIVRDVRAAYSYLASNDPRVHVGLGEFEAAADVVVRWADGTTESFGSLPANRVTTLRRGEGS